MYVQNYANYDFYNKVIEFDNVKLILIGTTIKQ